MNWSRASDISNADRHNDSPIDEMLRLAEKKPQLKIKRGARGFGFTLRAIKVNIRFKSGKFLDKVLFFLLISKGLLRRQRLLYNSTFCYSR